MDDVANLRKVLATRAKADIDLMLDAVETAFDPAVRDMENGAWASNAADIWFFDLTAYRDGVRTAIGGARDEVIRILNWEPDEVAPDDPRASSTR